MISILVKIKSKLGVNILHWAVNDERMYERKGWDNRNAFSIELKFTEGQRTRWICFLSHLFSITKNAVSLIYLLFIYPWAYIFNWLKSNPVKGTGSRFSACSFIKMLFFCRDMLYDHVIMLWKNQSAHSPGSHLISLCANNCKLINHGIKPSGQQQIQRWFFLRF